MKAILEFNLPQDQMQFDRVNKSLDMACALFYILQLRKTIEKRFDPDEGNVYDGIAIMAEEITDILESYDINVYKLNE